MKRQVPVLVALVVAMVWPTGARAREGSLDGVVMRISLPVEEETKAEASDLGNGVWRLDVWYPSPRFFVDMKARQRDLLADVQVSARTPDHLTLTLTLSQPDLELHILRTSRPDRYVLEIGSSYLFEGGLGDDLIPFRPYPMALPRIELHPRRPVLRDVQATGPRAEAMARAKMLFLQGRTAEVLRALREVRSEQDTDILDVEALYLQGFTLALAQGDQRHGYREMLVQSFETALSMEPTHPDAPLALLYLGETLEAMGRSEEAMERFHDCMEDWAVTRTAGLCRIRAAELAYDRRSFEDVERLLTGFDVGDETFDPQEEPDDIVGLAKMLKAAMAYRVGRMQAAASALGDLLTERPHMGARFPSLYFYFAEALVAMDEDELALPVYERLTKLTPNVQFLPRALTRLGDLALRRGEVDRANTIWRQVAIDWPRTKGGVMARMRYEGPELNRAEIIRFLGDIVLQGGDEFLVEEAMIRLARLLWLEDRFLAARQILAELDREHPGHPYRARLQWLWNRLEYLGYVAPYVAGDYLETVDRFVRNGVRVEGMKGEVGVRLVVARAYETLGLYGNAAKVIQEGLPRMEGHPSEQDILVYLAGLFVKQGRTFQIRKILQYIRTRFPKPARVERLAGIEADLARLEGDESTEIAKLQAYRTLGGDDPARAARLVHLLLASGRPGDALEIVGGLLSRPGARSEPWFGGAAVDLADALAALGRHRDAAAAYGRLLELHDVADPRWLRLRMGEELAAIGDREHGDRALRAAKEGGGFWGEVAARRLEEQAWEQSAADRLGELIPDNQPPAMAGSGE